MTNEEIDIINSMKVVVIRSIRYKRAIDWKDVMQNLFLKILNNYEKFGTLPNETEKKNYVFRSCKNLLIDMHRRREILCRKAVFTTLFMERGDEKSYPALHINENVIERLELKEELNEVLETLQKYTFPNELILNCQGWKVREIAVSTNQNLNTALGRIRYARTFLNENLHGQEN